MLSSSTPQAKTKEYPDKQFLSTAKGGKGRTGPSDEAVASKPAVCRTASFRRVTITHTKRVYSNGFYLGEAQDEKPVTCLFGKHELPKNRKWRFAVLPCESFGKKGAAIYSEWQDPVT